MRYVILGLLALMLQGCGSSGSTPAAAGGVSSGTGTVSPPATIVYTEQLSLAANSWVQGKPAATAQLVTEQGIRSWKQADDVIAVYLHNKVAGKIQLALSGKVTSGPAVLEVSIGEQVHKVQLQSGAFQQHAIGEFMLAQPGYHKILLRGVTSQGAEFADLDQLHLAGPAAQGVSFIRDEVYWGRRGPSVHLSYSPPPQTNVTWFYSEMRIEPGQDVIGSYFMANGFADGYFGIQVNSASERRVLFSVWSPYQTDDPSSIPADQQVRLLRKGQQVQTGEFGNEGAGGQSFLRYNWQAGVNYRFLLKGEPAADNFTHYSAWFYAPEQGQWQLIASFARPKTQRFIERPHSFLENFIPEMGDKTRSVLFTQQWFADAQGRWTANRQARFSVDNTGARGNRLDFKGALTEQGLLLQNCGFFSETTAAGTSWNLPVPTALPQVDLAQLP